jgi:hypothetical protein
MITAYFARVYQRDTGHLWRDFLFLLQEVRPIGKTRNRLTGKDLLVATVIQPLNPNPHVQVCHTGQLLNGMASGCPLNNVVRWVESRCYPLPHTSVIC